MHAFTFSKFGFAVNRALEEIRRSRDHGYLVGRWLNLCRWELTGWRERRGLGNLIGGSSSLFGWRSYQWRGHSRFSWGYKDGSRPLRLKRRKTGQLGFDRLEHRGNERPVLILFDFEMKRLIGGGRNTARFGLSRPPPHHIGVEALFQHFASAGLNHGLTPHEGGTNSLFVQVGLDPISLFL